MIVKITMTAIHRVLFGIKILNKLIRKGSFNISQRKKRFFGRFLQNNLRTEKVLFVGSISDINQSENRLGVALKETDEMNIIVQFAFKQDTKFLTLLFRGKALHKRGNSIRFLDMVDIRKDEVLIIKHKSLENRCVK